MITVIDCETTGTDAAVDRVVEFAAVPIHVIEAAPGSDLRPVYTAGEGVSSLVYPGIPIPPQASAVHHLIDEDVESAPPLGRAINQVLGPLWQSDENLICCAHNARFDRSFLPPLQNAKWLDTYRCAMHLFPDAPTHSNQGLRYALRLPVPRDLPVHRALGDCVVTAHLLLRLLQERSLDELLTLSRKAVVLKTIRFGKHKGMAWTEAPMNYLEWLAEQKSEDPDVRFTVAFELKRRAAIRKEGNLV